MTSWFRFWFLFSSFGPLYLIFAIKLWLNEGVTRAAAWTALTAFVLSIVVFAIIRSQLRSDNGTPFDLVDVKPKDSEIFSYITTYIPPLITRDMSTPDVYWPLIVLYAVIALAYMKLDSPYLNPFFILFGYRVYEGRMKDSRTLVTIISRRRRLTGTDRVTLYEIGTGDLYYCET
jgi:hypothetical protein